LKGVRRPSLTLAALLVATSQLALAQVQSSARLIIKKLAAQWRTETF